MDCLLCTFCLWLEGRAREGTEWVQMISPSLRSHAFIDSLWMAWRGSILGKECHQRVCRSTLVDDPLTFSSALEAHLEFHQESQLILLNFTLIIALQRFPNISQIAFSFIESVYMNASRRPEYDIDAVDSPKRSIWGETWCFTKMLFFGQLHLMVSLTSSVNLLRLVVRQTSFY